MWTGQTAFSLESPWHNCLRQNGDARPFCNFRLNSRSNVTVKCPGTPADSRRPCLNSRSWERLFWLKVFCCSFLAPPGKCQYTDFLRCRHDVFFFHIFQIYYPLMLFPLNAVQRVIPKASLNKSKKSRNWAYLCLWISSAICFSEQWSCL